MKCSKAKLCGGCPLLAVPYEKQALQKRSRIADMVEKAHLHLKVGQVHMAQEPAYYRNKVIVGFAKTPDKKVYSGLYAPKSHRIINTSGCLMQPEIVNQIIDAITHMVQTMKIQLYNPKTGTGLLRHVLIRYAKQTDQVMVVFVTTKKEFPSRRNLVTALTREFPQIVTIAQNINPRDTSIVLQDETLLLYGKGMITDELCGMKIAFSPSAFYQINHDQTEVLYTLAKNMLDLKPDDTVLDTYCGVGTIGLFMADACRQVTGVEINKDAVENARYNARLNQIKNIRFVAMDSTCYMSEACRMHQHYDAIILDPPRAGTTPQFIENACALRPGKILYISCDPTTQIRDLQIFRRQGYTAKTMELVDMFPNTDHIESVVVLSYTGFKKGRYPSASPKKPCQKPAGRKGSFSSQKPRKAVSRKFR